VSSQPHSGPNTDSGGAARMRLRRCDFGPDPEGSELMRLTADGRVRTHTAAQHLHLHTLLGKLASV
jgi:hypothetical protein